MSGPNRPGPAPGGGTLPNGLYWLVVLHVERLSDGLYDPIVGVDAGGGVCSGCGGWLARRLPGMGRLKPAKGELVDGRNTGLVSEKGTVLYLVGGGAG